MVPEMVPPVVEMLKALAEAENAVGDLYTVFAQTWKEDEAFWNAIVEQERKHARGMERAVELVTAKPEDFMLPRPPNVVVVRTFIRGVLGHTERARKKEIPRRNAFVIARDIEASILEGRVYELLKGKDAEFQGLMKEIETQTTEHNAEMKKKIFGMGS